MEPIEVDPWLKRNISALQSYRVDGPLFTIPYVFYHNLTLTKSKEKYFHECRRLPPNFSPILDELHKKPKRLDNVIELAAKETAKVYLQEGSSQHMTTILDGVDQSSVEFDHTDFLVTAETLNKIAGAVYNQERSFKLRSFVEKFGGKKMIVLCDDDLDGQEDVISQAMDFCKERLESAVFSQELCERQTNKPNHFLHGCLAVQSSIGDGAERVRMVVLGEIDMLVEQQPAISYVMSGIGRSDRADFGYEGESDRSYEYLWSRSFWLGLETCMLGLRKEDSGPVEVVQRYCLSTFHSNHRHRNDKEADVATSCVARVLIRLREAVHSSPQSNWIVEYQGRDATLEPGSVTICQAENSYSFWLVREKFHIEKNEQIYKRVKMSDSKIVRKFHGDYNGIKIRRKSGSITKQFRKYFKRN